MMERAVNTLSIWIHERHSPIFVSLWTFVLAVLISSFIRISPLVSILFFIIALGIYGAERIYHGEISREILLLIILLASFAFGILRYSIKDFHDIQQPTNTGIVVSEPEHRDTDTRFVVKTDNGEKILVSTDRLSKIEYGDEVNVSGKIQAPGVIDGFDYAAYLAKDDIYWVMNYAKIQSPAHGQASGDSRPTGFWLISNLLKIKNSFINKIKSILPEPEASLLAGLTVAGKEALPSTVLDDFKHAGVVHIVVLSGYNVTIIAEFFLFLLGFLGKRRAAIFSAIGIILFTLMTGATATVVRAAIMVLALLFGKIINRPYAPGRVLLFTAVLMLIWNPKYLIFDPSFQLSFLAMLALVYVTPLIQKYVKYEVVAVTIATQITVLPYLMYSVGSVSVVSLVSNVLILFFVPYTMLVGFVAVLLAYISSALAWPLALAAHILLKYILFVAHFLGNLSWASIQINHVSIWFTVLLYVVLGGLIARLRNFPRRLAN